MEEKKPDNAVDSVTVIVSVSDELSQRFKLMALVSSFLVVAIHCCSNFHMTNPLIRCGVYDGICRITECFFERR